LIWRKREESNRNSAGGSELGGAMAGFWSLRYLASKARFDERKVQGERGRDGDLT